jgi:phage-related baseplate assembly protein
MTTQPTFLSTDPSALVSAMVDQYQASTGKTLYKAQVENLWIQIMAYREACVRSAIQNAACQCLADFATGDNLLALGSLVGVTSRLAAAPAMVPVQIATSAPQGTAQVLPAGWSLTGPDGTAWTLESAVTIAAHSQGSPGIAQCSVTGPGQNGIPAGTTFTAAASGFTVVSSDVSNGGSDTETDDQLRTRILQAPFGFSVAGPSGSYEFFARGAHPSIVDVRALNGGGGIVNVYPLCEDGLPSQEVLDIVFAALSDESVRPLCDQVNVLAPEAVHYVIAADITLYRAADPTAVIPAVTGAAGAYVAAQAAKLGQPLIGSQVIAALSIPGVFKVELVGWTDRSLNPNQWADGTVAIGNVGFANV